MQDALEAKREFSRGQFYRSAAATPPGGYMTRLREALARAPAQVHAIGVGRKVTEGQRTNAVAVRFYVTQKLPKSLMPTDAILPEVIAGIPTDVVETPQAYFAAPPPCSLRRLKRQRPMLFGVSGGNEAVVAGTLGALCRSRRAAEAGLELVLSNNHVLADFDDAAPGSLILQPAVRDGGTGADRIGALLRSVPIQEGSLAGNRVDAALAQLDPGVVLGSDICTIGGAQGTTAPQADMVVQKHGRTTGHTVGVIDDPSVDFTIAFSRDEPHRVAQFVDQIRVTPHAGTARFAQVGDSGALLLTKSGNRAVGLIFACPDDASFAYANPIGAVLDALEVDLV